MAGVETSAKSDGSHRKAASHGRPRVRIPVHGIQTEGLVDTGSTYTLLDSSLYNRLPRRLPLQPAPRLLSISGDEVPTVGATIVFLAHRPQRVIVCPNLGIGLLLGVDVLRNCILDLPQKVIRFPECTYPLDLSHESFFSAASVVKAVPRARSSQVQVILDEFSSIFSDKSTPVTQARVPPAEIVTTCDTPIRQQGYRIPHTRREKVNECVDEMLRDGIIRPSNSPWASPITLVPKKDGSTRFCVDYRKVNAVTRKDAHPLPHIQNVFDSLQGARIFSTLDLKSGYWQVPMAPESVPKTAFTCHLGLFEFTRLPFGLANAPAIFRRAMNKVLSGLIGRTCMVYIDDIVIYSKSVEEHVQHLREVLERLRDVGLQLKPSKCFFELPEIELLGNIVSAAGIRPQPSKVQAIVGLAPPTDVKAVRSFLGMTGYYRQHVPDYAAVAAPLTEHTKKNQPFVWGEEQQTAFNTLKQALVEAPILAHADPSRPYLLYTDASNQAVGAILVQEDDEKVERVIAYLSHKLSGAQLCWPTIEKEAFRVVYALKKFHPYLWGAVFEILTDHKPLKSLFSAEIRNTKLQRWAIQISEHGAPIKYHPGKLNIRADMLSRIAAVRPAPDELTFDLSATPEIWRLDNIEPRQLSSTQQTEFADAWVEAEQEFDAPRITSKTVSYIAWLNHTNEQVVIPD